jgi:hypothetical protein
MGRFPPAGTAGVGVAPPGLPGPPGPPDPPDPPDPPGAGGPPDPPGTLHMVFYRLSAIYCDAIVIVLVAAGGVPGRTVVVAAVAVVVVVTIFVVVSCCSRQIVAMLEQCVFAGGRLGGLILLCGLLVSNAVGSGDVCSIGDVNHCTGSSSLGSSDVGCGAAGSSSDDSTVGLLS